MKLNPEDLLVESYATNPLPEASMESGVNTCYSCNLSDDDFTCRDACSSQPPGLTCHVGTGCDETE